MLKKLSLFKKLLIANILYAIPVIALIYLMVAAQNVNIDFGIQEKKGNLIQRPVENLLEVFLNIRSGIETDSKKAHDTAITILNDIENTLAIVGHDLQFDLEGLKKRKREAVEFSLLKNKVNDLFKMNFRSDDFLKKNNELVADLRTIITHAGDTSNLILDPDLDSYYLMDITLLALPQTQDRIAEILAYVESLPPSLSREQVTQLAVYQTLLKQADFDRISADLQTTLNEDANFYGVSKTLKEKLEPAIIQYTESTQKFIDALGLASQNAAIQNKDDLIKIGQKSLNSSFTSWHIAVNELDQLLDTRIDILTHQKHKGLVYSLLALMFAVAVLFWISQNFNSNMKLVIQKLNSVVAQTQSAGLQLVKLSENLSTVSMDQASAIQQTSSAVVEIESMTKTTLSNVSASKELSEESNEFTEKTVESVRSLASAIQMISNSNIELLQQMDQNKEQMNEIKNIISNIGQKTKVINEIVFQTKLLSFNASVEAARAGEFGKGFAVVAEEVGSLANLSGTASKEISEMLNTSITSVEKITTETSENVSRLVQVNKEKVDDGVNLATDCSTSVEEIKNKLNSVLEALIAVLQAASEQTKGLEEISDAITKIDELSQKNMKMSQQTAEQSKVLAEQTQALNEITTVVQNVVMGEQHI